MPMYDHECPNGHSFSHYASIKDFRRTRKCPDCGKRAGLVILKAPVGYVQRECVYDCPITGEAITSRAQHRDNLKRHGCQEYDPEMKKDAERFRRDQETRLERSIDETVERQIEAMPSRKKEMLERELSSGATAEIVRQTVA